MCSLQRIYRNPEDNEILSIMPVILTLGLLAKNAIRPFVCGRRNWLFSGSPEGAHATCAMFTLIETAKSNKLNPYVYLEYIFDQLAYVSTIEDFRKLLPTHIDREALRAFAAKNIPVEII